MQSYISSLVIYLKNKIINHGLIQNQSEENQETVFQFNIRSKLSKVYYGEINSKVLSKARTHG